MQRRVSALFAALLLTLLVRLAALLVLHNPVESDGLAYFTMADSAARGLPMVDNFGQVAFYSPGYALLLAPFFVLFGSGSAVALAVNLVLALVSAWLIFRIAERLGGTLAAFVAAAAYALWIPSAFAVTMLAKENLSIPLLLGFALALINLRDSPHPARWATGAGMAYGACLLAGASALLIIAGVGVVLIMRGWKQAAAPLLAFGIGSMLILGPWLIHTQRAMGTAALTTNSGFNLYLGNNPAATGSFVSIADTPMGPHWNDLRAALGEVESARVLGAAAQRYMVANPARTASLAATKLWLFWKPNAPDAADFKADAKIASARWVEVAQHILIVLGGLIGALLLWRRNPAVLIIASVILGFWAAHAATYNIVRYRDPVMPLMLILASLCLTNLWTNWQARRAG
jgi:Dolichyl-phosphate-mannose-protein mannosyltransferase